MGDEVAYAVAALHKSIAQHAQAEKNLIELVQLVQVCVDISGVVHLSLADFAEEHRGLMLYEIQCLNLLETGEKSFVHE